MFMFLLFLFLVGGGLGGDGRGLEGVGGGGWLRYGVERQWIDMNVPAMFKTVINIYTLARCNRLCTNVINI